MLILWIGLGAAAFYFLQAWLYRRLWDRGLTARLFFSARSVTEGESCCLSEQVENRKALCPARSRIIAVKIQFGSKSNAT